MGPGTGLRSRCRAERWVDLEPVGLPGHMRALFRLIEGTDPPEYQYVPRYPGAIS